MAFCCAAQTKPEIFRFKTAVSLNPTVLLATDLTAMVGAEHRLPHRLAVVLDAGYIFDTYYIQTPEMKGVSGFQLRPGLKWYNKRQKGFFQFQVAYKQVDYKMDDWLGKACVDGVPAYEQWQRFTYRKTALSFNVLAGELFRITDNVLLELYAGLGVKIKNQRPTEKDACYRNNWGEAFVFNTFQEHTVTANLPIGIKVLVPIK